MSATERPKIVVLIGRTVFREAYRAANAQETLAGKIVLSCGVFKGDPEWGEDAKVDLDELHRAKMRMADEVLLIEPDNIGESTRRELAYARELGLPVFSYTLPTTTVRVWYEGEHGESQYQDEDIEGVPGSPSFLAACQEAAREFRDERVPYGWKALPADTDE